MVFAWVETNLKEGQKVSWFPDHLSLQHSHRTPRLDLATPFNLHKQPIVAGLRKAVGE